MIGVIGRVSYWYVFCELVCLLYGVNIVFVFFGRILKRCFFYLVEMFWFLENWVIIVLIVIEFWNK